LHFLYLACSILLTPIPPVLEQVELSLDDDDDEDDGDGDLMLDGALSSSTVNALTPTQVSSSPPGSTKQKKQRLLVSATRLIGAPKRFKRYSLLGLSLH
jgi:hypothetical protein